MSGCWDTLIIENLALAFAMGIDCVPEDPELISVSLTNPAFSKDSEASTAKITARGKSLTEAFFNMQRQRDRHLVLGQTNTVVFSEECARSGQLDEILREINQQRDMNPNVLLAVVRGDKAQHVLYLEPPEQTRIAVYLKNLMERNYNTGIIPHVTASRYWYRTLTPGIDAVIPILEITGHEGENKGLAITGLGVFNSDGKMTGSLTDNEILYFQMLTEQPQRARFTTKADIDGQKRDTAGLIKDVKVKIETGIQEDIPRIAITLKVNVDLLDIDWDTDSLDPETVRTLEHKVALDFQGNCMDVLRKTQAWQSDIAGLGRYVRVQNPHWFRGRDWGEDYKKAQITMEAKVNIRRIGTLVDPLY